jgi:uncharacterized protein (TIGR02246 family)
MSYRRLLLAALLAVAALGLGAAFAIRHADDKGEAPPRDKGAPLAASGRLDPDQAAAEEKAIRARIAAFSAAYNKGDLNGVLEPWTDDAEFISEAGKAYRGKEKIRVLLKKALAGAKGSKQSAKVLSLRFVKPDVAIEEGEVTVTGKDGGNDLGRYEAVWLKLDGKWYMSRVRDLPDAVADEGPPATGKLKALEWMLGEWVDKDGKGDVTMTCKWAPGQAFLLQEFTVKQEGKEMIIRHRIGYDPAEGRIRSWVFDSSGGFADCVWAREGNTWVTDSNGTFPDGRRSSSTNRWKYIDDNSFTWSSRDREVEEQPLPDVEVKFIRKKGS